MRCGLRSGPARCAPIPPRSRRWRWWGRCSGTGARCPKTGPRPALSAPSVWHRIHPPSMLKRCRHRLKQLRPRHDERQTDPDEHLARRAHRVVRARGLCARGAGDSAAGGAVPRPLRRGHPEAHVSHDRSAGTRAVPAPRPHHSGLARLSRLARGRQTAGLLLSRSGLPPSRRGRRRIPAGRHRILRPPRHGGGGCRNAGAWARRHGALRPRRAGHPHGRRRTVFRPGGGARSRARLEAAPDQGLQPQDVAGARSRSAYHRRFECALRISGRARRARRLRPQGGARARHRSPVDCGHHRGRRTLGGRNRRAFPRAGRARRADLAAARDARADRKIPRHRRRSRQGRGRAARVCTRGQDRARGRARRLRKPHRLAGRARRRRRPHSLLDRLRPRPRLLHRFRVRAARPARARGRPAGGGRPLRRVAHAARQRPCDRRGRICGVDRAAGGVAEHIMSAPFVLAVPAKGRLQANMEAFFARVGLELVKPRGARDYRGTIANLPGVEVAYLSAAEVVDLLAQGAVHLGVTGEDLVREKIPDADRRVVFVDALGFGHANVAVAVPQAWIDVHSMADLDDVAIAFRLKHERKMRVATKYVNLTRDFFSSHGVTDYRIVESSGATEAAPAAGTAELIVDITTTGATLAANGLKVIDDGVILRSQANLIAARTANWGAAPRATARSVLDRIAAQTHARAFREVRTRFARCDEALIAEARQRFGVETPFGGPTSSGMLTLHCPPNHVHALATLLRNKGAENVVVADLGYVFARADPLYAKLEAGLAPPS